MYWFIYRLIFATICLWKFLLIIIWWLDDGWVGNDSFSFSHVIITCWTLSLEAYFKEKNVASGRPATFGRQKSRIDLQNLLVQKSAGIASSFKHVAPWWERPGTLSARTATPLSVEASGDDAICQTTFVAIRGRDNVDSYKSTVSCNP